MKNKKLHSAWCIIFLAAMLLAVPCWAQQDAVAPPEEPASPAVEEVKDVDVDKTEAETTVKPDRDVNAAESREKTEKESTSVKKDAPRTPKKVPGDEASQVKEVKKKADEPVSSSPSRKDDAAVDEGRLLSITDGSFKYRRISDIQLDESKAESEQLMADTESEPEVEKENNQAPGLFGMDKETTDIVAWLILGLIILLVFILYRVRARERPGRVLRRFPRV